MTAFSFLKSQDHIQQDLLAYIPVLAWYYIGKICINVIINTSQLHIEKTFTKITAPWLLKITQRIEAYKYTRSI